MKFVPDGEGSKAKIGVLAQDLSKSSFSNSTHKVHLEKPVLGHYIPYSIREFLFVQGKDIGYPPHLSRITSTGADKPSSAILPLVFGRVDWRNA